MLSVVRTFQCFKFKPYPSLTSFSLYLLFYPSTSYLPFASSLSTLVPIYLCVYSSQCKLGNFDKTAEWLSRMATVISVGHSWCVESASSVGILHQDWCWSGWFAEWCLLSAGSPSTQKKFGYFELLVTSWRILSPWKSATNYKLYHFVRINQFLSHLTHWKTTGVCCHWTSLFHFVTLDAELWSLIPPGIFLFFFHSFF